VMIDSADKPEGIELKDIPAQFVVNGRVDWKTVRTALGLATMEDVKDALLFLYFSNWRVNYAVNEALLRAAVPALAGLYKLPPPPDTDEEAPWLAADIKCEQCPGSQYIDYGGGFAAPRCGLVGRVDRYTDCQQYRGHLQQASLTSEEAEELYQKALGYFEEIYTNVKDRTSGHVGPSVGSDRSGATEVVQRLVDSDSRRSPGTGSD